MVIINTNSVNFTKYQFFTDNGTILNYSVCLNIQIKVQKKVETKKLDISLLEELEKKFEIKLFDNDDELKDYCTPLFINNKDLTLYDKLLLSKENIKPCDDNCIYQSFNFATNYSTCICFIIQKNYEELINEIILEKIKDNFEEMDSLNKLLNKGNVKYFECFIKSFKYIKFKKLNFLAFISLAFSIFGIIFTKLYFSKNHDNIIAKYKKIEKDKEIKMKASASIKNPIKKNKKTNISMKNHNFNKYTNIFNHQNIIDTNSHLENKEKKTNYTNIFNDQNIIDTNSQLENKEKKLIL